MVDGPNNQLAKPELRQLGDSDLFVSPVGLGCWPIAGMSSLDVNLEDSKKTLAAAIDSGINFLDTAHAYGVDGLSERLVGEAIRGRRDDLVIASKGGVTWVDGKATYIAKPEQIIAECEESLRRLNIDTIDLYYLHNFDAQTPLADTAGAYAELRAAGKIREAAVSNLNAQQTETFHSVCKVTAVQPPFNMLQQDIRDELLPWCAKNGVSAVTYWPLMKGLLAGKIRRGHQFDPADKRLGYEVFQGDNFDTAQKLLDQLDLIAAETEKTVAQVVTNWTFHQPGITSVLCGAKRDWQISETAGAMGWKLSAEQLSKIDACLA
jgi:aryl-alcohol dehydrogenase-like predicted oxidoreductase